MPRSYYVYISASKKNGTLYIGITNDSARRIYEHKQKATESFTKKYQVDKLVYYEIFEDVREAIIRESRLKDWKREWKIKLIEENNKNWDDLYFLIEW